jgi:hypothetical protein
MIDNMKKHLILCCIIFLFAASVSAQAKKKTTSRPTEQSVIAARAKKWFREVYVASTFKNPYSYKLLKFDIYPVSYATEAENDLESAQFEIDRANLTLNKIDTLSEDSPYKRHNKVLKELKVNYDTNLQSYGQDNPKTRQSLLKYNEQFLIVHRDTTGLYEATSAFNTYNTIKKKLSTVKSKSIMYYYIDLDCYGNNSYGGKILGSYFFKFNKDGIAGEVTQRDR